MYYDDRLTVEITSCLVYDSANDSAMINVNIVLFCDVYNIYIYIYTRMCIRKGPRSYHTRRRRVGMMAAAKRYTYVLYRSAAFSSLILINQQIITSLQYYATLAVSLSLSRARARPHSLAPGALSVLFFGLLKLTRARAYDVMLIGA
jgi:hypothetical protein